MELRSAVQVFRDLLDVGFGKFFLSWGILPRLAHNPLKPIHVPYLSHLQALYAEPHPALQEQALLCLFRSEDPVQDGPQGQQQVPERKPREVDAAREPPELPGSSLPPASPQADFRSSRTLASGVF